MVKWAPCGLCLGLAAAAGCSLRFGALKVAFLESPAVSDRAGQLTGRQHRDAAEPGPALRRALGAGEGEGSAPAAGVPYQGLFAGAALGAAVLVAARRLRTGGSSRSARARSGTTRLVATIDSPEVQGASAGSPEKLEQYVKEHGGSKPLRRILIANNGMAAAKAILSMRQWAYLELGETSCFEFVVMATREDLDANAEFIRLADTYVEVPGGKNVNNYANVDLICETASAQRVDAVWPGWGHASENPKLPAKLQSMGIVFIGPTSPVMSVLGDKIAANILAQTAGVPSIPWSGDGLEANLTEEGTIPDEIFQQGLISSLEEAVACADRIGYPVMLKASEGGGGKGIRMSANRQELEQNYPQVLAEVPGSPVFMMQLCQGARHIEVQIVGDMHGKAVALNGRDCSTQRRFQKIFEEGPPSIVPKETFREMEKAAQRLTQSIGYIGAGTVEYLYNAQENKFYFLELNPRLQVEHPVTEEITGVNLPATQLQVLMGIPLDRIPEVRMFYGKAPSDAETPIDFLEDDYVYPASHVIAARITAENPDDGFKPTSGRIERIKFQSSVSCWGYFSVGANGAIHEFADSQFGHIFARGKDREESRKVLTLALKQLEVVGEIRNPVEYLVELLNTGAFKDNTIDTSWLDGLIKAKSVGPRYEDADVVFYAAVFRAMATIRAKEAAVMEDLSKSQLGLLREVGSINHFPIEITFDGMKYRFEVARTGRDKLLISIAGTQISARVREQPDGSIFVSIGNSVMKVFGTEEALGLRLRLAGIATIMLPTIYDPSELRSEFNGKVVRYLQDNGAAVKEGEPYVELEAMKMIMPLRATASGRISHRKGTGSIVQAGDLLGQLELEDLSSVQKVVDFQGEFKLSTTEVEGAPAAQEESPLEEVMLVMDGYNPSSKPTELVGQLFGGMEEGERAGVACTIIDRYLEVESNFVDPANERRTDDQVQAALIDKYKDDLKKVLDLSLSHSQLAIRNEVVLAVLRTVRSLGGSADLLERINSCSKLPTKGEYDEVVLLARQDLNTMDAKPFEQRTEELRQAMATADSFAVSAMTKWSSLRGGVDLLVQLFGDEDASVRRGALETFVRRIYRAYRIYDLEVKDDGPSRLSVKWGYQYPGVSSDSALREGYCVVVPEFSDVREVLDGPLPFVKKAEDSAPLNSFHVVVGKDVFAGGPERLFFNSTDAKVAELCGEVEGMLKAADSELTEAGMRGFCLMLPQAPHQPRFCTFMQAIGWKEELARRDMRPTFPHLLEVNGLAKDYDLDRVVPTIGRNSQVYWGTQKGVQAGRLGKPCTIFVRMISHSPLKVETSGDGWMVLPESLILQGVDEVERAKLQRSFKPAQAPNARIFLHLMSLVDMDNQELEKIFEEFMNRFVSKCGGRLQQSRVDEIVVKVGVGKEPAGRKETLRFSASSMTGEYLKTVSLIEEHDPVTGQPVAWYDIDTRTKRALSAVPEGQIQAKRSMARRAGSTYAPEFLGMMKVGLIEKWNAQARRSGFAQTPANVFQATELVMDAESGELKEVSRAPGSNDVGMVAWRCTLQTPEYPLGRDIVLIANDVTFQAGSFGVAEDGFFQKASEFARKRGLPRIYISCNSGARVGLVEELKPYVQVKWTEPGDPAKGFDYLYLTEEDYSRFGEGVVKAHPVTCDGATHYAIDAIIGEGMKSTAGGIGVENLQGSGLIAGETSRAYDEVFTLSYITGRSVGIGAYLNRLGQRTIQMVNGPMILTGFAALNKLLGRSVYTSQDQLGGPQVMVPNGVTHQLVQSDQEGVAAILDWLSYVPKDTWSPPSVINPTDPPERDVTFTPSKTPYDPRHMLAGTVTPEGAKLTGFFDEGTFQEYLGGWGRSVVVGRAKLGGIPMGVIAVETRNVDRRVPADPANPQSREVVEPQAGQVWFPDSAFKTATALRDFNRGENLPVMIFANWRGFSGGTRDMYGEVLKFGAQIVDALVDYQHPVFVYIPPGGELRGGSWVVIDPAINPSKMEMYADVESRGGILEPAGIIEVKFREQDQLKMMHRLDDHLISLDAQQEAVASTEVQSGDVAALIKAREEQLKPVYTQLACEFADLHDRTGRMEAKGVIRKALEWRRSREFFYTRLRRRMLEKEVTDRLCKADSSLTEDMAKEKLNSWMPAGTSDQEAMDFLEQSPLEDAITKVATDAKKRRIEELMAQLSPEEQKSLQS